MPCHARPPLVAASLLALSAPLTAQITFQRTYGGASWDYGYSVQQTTDGGFIVAGYTNSFGAGYDDVWLLKTDSLGDTLWTRTYGGREDDRGYSVVQTADGGCVVTGSTRSFGVAYEDVWLIRTDASGDTVWTRTYGGQSHDVGRSVVQTADSGFVIVGSTASFGAGGRDVWLLKTNAQGELIWARTIGGGGVDDGYSVEQTADSGFVIGGSSSSFPAPDPDVWLIRTDADGETLWTRTYGGTDIDQGFSAQQTADGGYVATGYTRSFGAGGADAWLIKTDAVGDTMWTRTFGSEFYNDAGFSVRQTTDSGYVMAGAAGLLGPARDVWLIKTDSAGDTAWTRTWGGNTTDEGWSVQQAGDGSYIVAGYTSSFGAGSFDVFLIKTDSLGNVGVEEPRPPLAAGHSTSATICRGVLHLGAGKRGQSTTGQSLVFLLDAAGRKAMPLRPGPNDVSGLSAGVYFLRGPASTRPIVKVR